MILNRNVSAYMYVRMGVCVYTSVCI